MAETKEKKYDVYIPIIITNAMYEKLKEKSGGKISDFIHKAIEQALAEE